MSRQTRQGKADMQLANGQCCNVQRQLAADRQPRATTACRERQRQKAVGVVGDRGECQRVQQQRGRQ